ncbi:MAG: NAD(+) synthase, partial [Methanomicrobia archaeon]|nr:NAD(+) synthase [Methanomicrobia archaeon]
MKLQVYLDQIIQFLKEKLNEGFDGYVLGISGGIDSAVVAALAKKAVGDKLFCLVLPCESRPEDEDDARLLAESLDLSYQVVDLTSTYQTLMREVEPKALRSDSPLDKLAHMNAKVRLRMVTLYAFSQSRRSLVLGTDNWDESYT